METEDCMIYDIDGSYDLVCTDAGIVAMLGCDAERDSFQLSFFLPLIFLIWNVYASV